MPCGWGKLVETGTGVVRWADAIGVVAEVSGVVAVAGFGAGEGSCAEERFSISLGTVLPVRRRGSDWFVLMRSMT